MNLLMQLRKVCNHTYLLDQGDAPNPYVVDERLVGGSGKLLLLDQLLPRLKQDGHRILLFSQFTSTLDLLEDYCRLRHFICARVGYSVNYEFLLHFLVVMLLVGWRD